MSFKEIDREQLVAWAQENQPKAAAARKRKGQERAQNIMQMLESGYDARQISFELDISLSAAHIAIHRAKKRMESS